jgi:ketosteroid isomerase-like protein
MSEANKRTALDFMTEFSSGNRAAAWQRATDDVTWTMMRRTPDSTDLDRYTRDAYDAMVAQSGGLFPDGITMEFLSATADGDRVALEATSEGRLASGHVYRNNYVFLLKFTGPKVRSVQEFLDTAYARDVLMSDLATPKGGKT